MKRIRCPKCDEPILFDETLYEAGRRLVFECPLCRKQFMIKIPKEQSPAEEEEQKTYATLVVVENAFHLRQELQLHEGNNVIGRSVKGSSINTPIMTVDPSVDTTHCIVNVRIKKDGTPALTLRDAPSGTGTFLNSELLGNRETAPITDGDIITIGATTLIVKME